MNQDRPYSDIAKKRFKLLMDFDRLKADGGTQAVILDVLGITRSTYFKWKGAYEKYGLVGLEPGSKRPKNIPKPMWDKKLEILVLRLRNQEPTWGKNKIHRLLVRDHGAKTSVTTVGRIITKLIRQDKVKTAYFAANK